MLSCGRKEGGCWKRKLNKWTEKYGFKDSNVLHWRDGCQLELGWLQVKWVTTKLQRDTSGDNALLKWWCTTVIVSLPNPFLTSEILQPGAFSIVQDQLVSPLCLIENAGLDNHGRLGGLDLAGAAARGFNRLDNLH